MVTVCICVCRMHLIAVGFLTYETMAQSSRVRWRCRGIQSVKSRQLFYPVYILKQRENVILKHGLSFTQDFAASVKEFLHNSMWEFLLTFFWNDHNDSFWPQLQKCEYSLKNYHFFPSLIKTIWSCQKKLNFYFRVLIVNCTENFSLSNSFYYIAL